MHVWSRFRSEAAILEPGPSVPERVDGRDFEHLAVEVIDPWTVAPAKGVTPAAAMTLPLV